MDSPKQDTSRSPFLSSVASRSFDNVDASSQAVVLEASLLTETNASISILSSTSSRVVKLCAKFAVEVAAHQLAVKNEALTRKRRIADMLRADEEAEEQVALSAAKEEARPLAEASAIRETKDA